MKNLREIKIIAALFALIAGVAAEHFSEKWWIVKTPSGNLELYHGPASYFSLLVVAVVVATITYKVIVRIFSR